MSRTLARKYKPVLIALLQNEAPAARSTQNAQLQTYLAQADTALLVIAHSPIGASNFERAAAPGGRKEQQPSCC